MNDHSQQTDRHAMGTTTSNGAGVEVVRWTHSELPPSLGELVSEAVLSGHAWASKFHAAWRSGPFTSPGEALFLTFEGNQLLAMAAICADPFVDDATTGRLRFIYVRSSARRRGLADRLVKDCLTLARGRWRKLRLHTDSAVAARLYERYGFRPTVSDPRATHVMDVPP
jgi:GNAT superfamily N-acetyltransferase